MMEITIFDKRIRESWTEEFLNRNSFRRKCEEEERKKPVISQDIKWHKIDEEGRKKSKDQIARLNLVKSCKEGIDQIKFCVTQNCDWYRYTFHPLFSSLDDIMNERRKKDFDGIAHHVTLPITLSLLDSVLSLFPFFFLVSLSLPVFSAFRISLFCSSKKLYQNKVRWRMIINVMKREKNGSKDSEWREWNDWQVHIRKGWSQKNIMNTLDVTEWVDWERQSIKEKMKYQRKNEVSEKKNLSKWIETDEKFLCERFSFISYERKKEERGREKRVDEDEWKLTWYWLRNKWIGIFTIFSSFFSSFLSLRSSRMFYFNHKKA